MSFSDKNSSFVRRRCFCRFIFFIFSSSSSETHGQFQPNFAQSIFESLRKDVYSKEGSHPFPRADNKKIIEKL